MSSSNPDDPPGRARGATALADLVLLAVTALAAVALCTPLVGFGWHPGLSLFGLPTALIWVIFWLCVVFAALGVAYLNQPTDDVEVRAGSDRVGEGGS